MQAYIRIPKGYRRLHSEEWIETGDYCLDVSCDGIKPKLEWQRWKLKPEEEGNFFVHSREVFIRKRGLSLAQKEAEGKQK